MSEKGHVFNHIHVRDWAGSELLTDGGMEAWASATNLTNWTEVVAGTSTVNREGSEIHAGTYSCRFDVDASNNFAYIWQAFSTTGQSFCRLTLWYNIAGAGDSAYLLIKDNTSTVYLASDHITWGGWAACAVLTATSGWASVSFDFIPHSSYTDYEFVISKNDADSASLYFDDASILGFVAADTVDIEGGVIKVDATQVVGARVIDADFANTPNSGDADTDDLIDKIRDALITHGLIASS